MSLLEYFSHEREEAKNIISSALIKQLAFIHFGLMFEPVFLFNEFRILQLLI